MREPRGIDGWMPMEVARGDEVFFGVDRSVVTAVDYENGIVTFDSAPGWAPEPGGWVFTQPGYDAVVSLEDAPAKLPAPVAALAGIAGLFSWFGRRKERVAREEGRR